MARITEASVRLGGADATFSWAVVAGYSKELRMFARNAPLSEGGVLQDVSSYNVTAKARWFMASAEGNDRVDELLPLAYPYPPSVPDVDLVVVKGTEAENTKGMLQINIPADFWTASISPLDEFVPCAAVEMKIDTGSGDMKSSRGTIKIFSTAF